MREALAKVLVIDDNPGNLDMLSELLDQEHFVVLFALDGLSGIQRAETGQPDIILLDIMMPGMDGFETCRRLKFSEKTRDIPVIFMTALLDMDDKVKAFEAGGTDYITKPHYYAEVLARINTHVTLRTLQKQLGKKRNYSA